ncbi:hypothetical protein M4D79_21205 [Mycolicibacterium novocastrense]|nr:hypothetical protein A5759_03855 [Mycobacterium sp. 852014-52144_SCH5372336]UUO04282.1 hypothetical protein M4D79_21205 [Mycolicibacterium novocastrense]
MSPWAAFLAASMRGPGASAWVIDPDPSRINTVGTEVGGGGDDSDGKVSSGRVSHPADNTAQLTAMSAHRHFLAGYALRRLCFILLQAIDAAAGSHPTHSVTVVLR